MNTTETVTAAGLDTADLMDEARGWLADCGLPYRGTQAQIEARVEREYGGGWAAFIREFVRSNA